MDWNLEILKTTPFVIFRVGHPTLKNELKKIANRFPAELDHAHISPDQKRSREIFLTETQGDDFIRLIDRQLEINDLAKLLIRKLWPKIIFTRRDLVFIDILRFIVLGYWPFDVRCELSEMPVGSSIPPHTDGFKKIISLMIYFPRSASGGDEHLGTVFWSSNKSNYENQHLRLEDEAEFRGGSEQTLRLPFDSNYVYGFCRNSVSWHSVDPVENQDLSYKRRSLNINIYWDETFCALAQRKLVSWERRIRSSSRLKKSNNDFSL